MVGLCAAGGEHHLRALALGVRQQELQLTHLVAAQTDTGQVVALDIHIGVQQTADVLQLLDGGWTAPPAEYGGNPANSSVFVDKAVN